MRFDTVLGNIDVRLFHTATPQSTDNFTDNYANIGRYDDTFVHRSVSNFVIQGGGFFLDPDIFSATHVTTTTPVVNEPGISNIRTTLSMAKVGGDPNSATSEWFFSFNHNTQNLDNQNGGFTVFGAVVGSGMSVVDAIAALPTINAGGAFTNIPVLDLDKVIMQQNIFSDDAVLINSVSVIGLPDGDYTFDGTVDVADLAIWQADYGRLKFIGGDFNDDTEMDSDDLLIWESNFGAGTGAINYTHGDSNGDRSVNGGDFLDWQRGYNHTVDAAADGNGDAQINGTDFLAWQRSFAVTLALSAATTIPEPSSLVLLCLAPQLLPRAAFRGRR